METKMIKKGAFDPDVVESRRVPSFQIQRYALPYEEVALTLAEK